MELSDSEWTRITTHQNNYLALTPDGMQVWHSEDTPDQICPENTGTARPEDQLITTNLAACRTAAIYLQGYK